MGWRAMVSEPVRNSINLMVLLGRKTNDSVIGLACDPFLHEALLSEGNHASRDLVV